MDPLHLTSCNSIWTFDTERRRFRRRFRGADTEQHEAVTEWRPYYGLDIEPDSDAFVVWLNPEGTRLLRSWRHVGDRCAYCDGERTTELSLGEINKAV